MPLILTSNLKIAALLIGIFLMSASLACSESRRSPESITIEEATAILENAHRHAVDSNLTELCDLGGSTLSCEFTWRNRGEWDAVAHEPPTIAGTRLMPDVKRENGNTSLGGLVLIVEGTDGIGNEYSTDYLIFDDGEKGLVALNPIYWTGTSVGHSASDGSSTAQPNSTSASESN